MYIRVYIILFTLPMISPLQFIGNLDLSCYSTENPEEWREGVLVGFLKKDLSKVRCELWEKLS